MKSAKGHHQYHHHEEVEEEDDELFGGTKKDAVPSISNPTSNNNAKDGKNSGKANATRSKHSVTEQKRRSKINERFQILRDLIPHSDQKRDTASFLLEVIQYVQYLQEKVQKYEGTYQPWSSEPTKLMPWRNTHWRIQSFVGQPNAMNNSGQGPTIPGRFNENDVSIPSIMQSSQHNPIESDGGRDPVGKSMNPQSELLNKRMAVAMPMQTSVSVPVQNGNAVSISLPRPSSDAQLADCPIPGDALNQQEELTVEGGTISISSAYSEGLLSSLTEALQTAGVDLSQATVSVQINLGKRANRGVVASGISVPKDEENPMLSGNQPMGHFQDSINGEDLDQSHKRLKI